MHSEISRRCDRQAEVERLSSQPRPVLHALLLICLLSGLSPAQDPFVIAPRAYKLDFENDWVRVIRVHYAPFEKIAPHDHPKRQTVFIYLNDGGPVRFKHVEGYSGDYPAIRPPTKARAFRLASVQGENHEVENLSNLPSDFLQVELKTETVDSDSFKGRYLPEPRSAQQPEDYRKTEFENGQARISRLACRSKRECGPLEVERPAILIALSPLKLRLDSKATDSSRQSLSLGKTKWLPPGSRLRIGGSVENASEILLIEFKSKPTQPAAGNRR